MQTVPPPHKSFRWQHQRPQERKSVLRPPIHFPERGPSATQLFFPRGDIGAVAWHVFHSASAALRCLTAVDDPAGLRGNISSTMYKRKWRLSAVIRRQILSKDVPQLPVLPRADRCVAGNDTGAHGRLFPRTFALR
ncbi:hypothetical protein MTO96_014416 [Rhipicephalus appendiculatus]